MPVPDHAREKEVEMRAAYQRSALPDEVAAEEIEAIVVSAIDARLGAD